MVERVYLKDEKEFNLGREQLALSAISLQFNAHFESWNSHSERGINWRLWFCGVWAQHDVLSGRDRYGVVKCNSLEFGIVRLKYLHTEVGATVSARKDLREQ